MYGIKDGILQNLPTTGYLKDGSSVSNYDSMGIEELELDGWVEIREGCIDTDLEIVS